MKFFLRIIVHEQQESNKYSYCVCYVATTVEKNWKLSWKKVKEKPLILGDINFIHSLRHACLTENSKFRLCYGALTYKTMLNCSTIYFSLTAVAIDKNTSGFLWFNSTEAHLDKIFPFLNIVFIEAVMYRQ